MKPFVVLFLVICLLRLLPGCTAPEQHDPWVKQFQRIDPDKKYRLDSFLKPAFLDADFNGDEHLDRAFTIVEKATGKKGILLMHGNSNAFFVFGAGTIFGKQDDDDYSWSNQWSLYKQKTAYETEFDSESGDILGAKEVLLQHPAILVEQLSDGLPIAGGIIHWNGKEYVWIHQGE